MKQNEYSIENYLILHTEILNAIEEESLREEIKELLIENFNRVNASPNGKEGIKLLCHSPFTTFIWQDCFVFGYMPKIKVLQCLNDTLVVREIEEDQIDRAIGYLLQLYNSYGFINVPFNVLEEEVTQNL